MKEIVYHARLMPIHNLGECQITAQIYSWLQKQAYNNFGLFVGENHWQVTKLCKKKKNLHFNTH